MITKKQHYGANNITHTRARARVHIYSHIHIESIAYETNNFQFCLINILVAIKNGRCFRKFRFCIKITIIFSVIFAMILTLFMTNKIKSRHNKFSELDRYKIYC